MRQVGNGKGQISAYPRQLESLIRLAEAHAKVRLSDKVEEKDVEEAKRFESIDILTFSFYSFRSDFIVKH